MIWAKIVWGVVLAGLLGFSFHRSWKLEHVNRPDGTYNEKNGIETVVLVEPTALFWILLAFFVLFIVFFGWQNGMTRFEALMIDVMLILCVYYLVLLIILPLLRNRFSARACALLWLVHAFLSWQGHALMRTTTLPKATIYIPQNTISIIGIIWLVGFIAVGGYFLISHLIFSINVRRKTEDVTDADVLAVWQSEQEKLNYLRPVRLLRGDVSAPFSMGRTRLARCTVLPNRSYTQEELSMIFSHELHHLQRCDVSTKAFLCMCNALCWFNPLVWIATRKAAEDLERSCDEIVTEGMQESQRHAYAKLILDSAAPIRGCTTCLSAAAGTLRYRLHSVVNQKKRLLGTGILMVTLFVCVMCFGVVSLSDIHGSFSSLILPSGVEITTAYYDDYSSGNEFDEESLINLLDGIELEHVAGLRNPWPEKEEITIILSDGEYVSLSQKAIVVHDYHNNKNIAEYYLIKGDLDWDALKSCLK